MPHPQGPEPFPHPGFEVAAQRPDYTGYDLTTAPLYRTRDQQAWPAEQLTEPRTIVRSWGVQDMDAGDWVVYKGKSGGELKPSGVRRVAFEATYVPVGNGQYRKEAYVRALLIPVDYQFTGVDSDRPELAPAGSYLTLNLDRHRRPIIVDGKPDVFFYSARDLKDGFEPVRE